MEISVIIPTYNRRETFRKCLLSLLEQDYPKERYEIIVVDDGSSDGTVEVVDTLAKAHKNFRYIQQDRKGPACARNSGIREARGEIIGFTDDDCVLDKHWIRLMVESHKRNPHIITVGGLTGVPYKRSNIMVSQSLSNSAIQTNINGREEVIFFPTCNVAFKRHIFAEYRFNEEFPLPGGEDLEFFWRLFKSGHRFIWDKEIRVTHYRADTLSSFIKQAYIYGRGNLLAQYVHNDHPLLKELKTGRTSFWAAVLVNIMKIPRFSYLLGKRLIRESGIKDIRKKISIYLYFVLHKISYISGNISEFFRIRRSPQDMRPYHIPRLLILDITHSCNLSCRVCDIWKTKDTEQDLDMASIKKVLLEAKDSGIREIALSGGEPLLRDDIFEILEYAQKIKIKDLGVLTNGILLEQHLERLRPYIIDNTISLVVSFDSLDEEVHNFIRGSDTAWQRTSKGLEMLSSLKKKYPHINFNVIAIILGQSLEELLALADFIKGLGANSLQFQALLPNNLKMAERKESPFWVSAQRLGQLDATIDSLIEFKIKNPKFIKNSVNNLSLVKQYYRGSLSDGEVKCLSAHQTVLISNQGNCTTCFSSYGDVKEKGLNDILASKERARAREEVKRCSSPCLLPCFCDIDYGY